MKIITYTLCFIVAIFLLTECSNKDVPLAPKIESLIGTWRLLEPDSTYGVTLIFALDTANPPHDVTPFLASGKSSINTYTVRLFATIDGTLSADNLGSTKVGGNPTATKFEQSYFTNLKAVVRYELVSPGRLRLYHGGEEPHVMVYEKVN